MQNNNYFFGEPDSSYNSVLDKMAHTEVHTCETSSIPLADFWHPRNEGAISQLIDLLGLGLDLDKMQKCFEYPVFAERKGNQIGRPSMTDLMLINNQYRIAIEGKYTEKLYDTIAKWKKNIKKNSNKPDVLASWYDYIKNYASFDENNISKIEHEVVYQFLHRTASACHKCDESGQKPILIYQLFYNEKEEKSKRRQEDVASSLKTFAEEYLRFNEKIQFFIVLTPLINVDEVKKNNKKTDSGIFLKMKESPIYKFGNSLLFEKKSTQEF